jgi:hypothetical protein
MMGQGLAFPQRNRLRQPRREIMPLITVSYSSSRQTPSLKADIAASVSDLTAKILPR